MKVYHLIYTKVAPENSPWKKTDFHSVFYPLELLSKNDLYEIERKIYFPNLENFNEKHSVFFQKIQNKFYLIVLNIKNLPNERDTFGRAGIFICHGFIFPPELWMHIPHPLSLLSLVEQMLLTNRNEIFSSPLIDTKTGNALPIEISEESLENFSNNLQKIISIFEWNFVLILNRLSQMKFEERPAVLVKGSPNQISILLNKLIAYVPNELKTNLGWDNCFDNGNLTFYPIKIVGFNFEKPRGGESFLVNIDQAAIYEPNQKNGLLIPESPYEIWLASQPDEISSYEQIEKAYNLSLFLNNGVFFSPENFLTENEGFAKANKKFIKEVFISRCSKILGNDLSNRISIFISPKEMLDLIIEDFSSPILSNFLERVILEYKLTPDNLNISIPNSYFENGSNKLKFIYKIWSGESLQNNELDLLELNEQLELIKYLLFTKWNTEDWFANLLSKNNEIFKQIIENSEAREIIHKILLKRIEKFLEFRQISDILLQIIIEQNREFDLLQNNINFWDNLELYLKQLSWNDAQMKILISWAKNIKYPLDNFPYPYVKSFLFPKYEISDIVLNSNSAREKLIETLIKHFNYSIKDFEKLGLSKNELMEIQVIIKNQDNWFNKLKNLFSIN